MIKNIITGDFYIGSASRCLYTRWKDHYTLLNINKHHNTHLQNAVNKYGLSSFVFGVIEYCDSDNCLTLEQKYIDELNPSYNLCRIAGNTTGVKKSLESIQKVVQWHTGRKRSEESRQRMREARKNYKPSEEHKRNIGISCMGHIGHSHRQFIVISPDGIIYERSGIRPFCKEFGLNQGAFNQMVLGKLPQYKGWKLVTKELE